MQSKNKTFCGLDFGTSNSTIGATKAQQIQLIPLENSKTTIRSAIFCDAERKKLIFGQEGINRYLESTPGRLLMALKSVLGSSLMDDETLIFNEFVSYKRILGKFVEHLKTTAEYSIGNELTQVVMGRPVRFHDTDSKVDKKAQDTLAQIAQDVGFKEVLFQYEPIAAALTYEQTIRSEQLALIIDMGGGTSDFTIIRLRPQTTDANRSDDVLANCGIHIAGTDFDHDLSLHSVMPLLGLGSVMQGSSSIIEVPAYFYHDLTTWHSLSMLYSAKNISQLRSIQTVAQDKQLISRLIRVIQNREGHHLLDAVETCKQKLSDEQIVRLDLSFIEDELAVGIEREHFNATIAEDVKQIIDKILETVKIADVSPTDINAIFYTGGSTKIPVIREQINALFPNASVVVGDAFGSVGLGLTIDAERRFA